MPSARRSGSIAVAATKRCPTPSSTTRSSTRRTRPPSGTGSWTIRANPRSRSWRLDAVVVEIKGYRGEDAKDKKATMETSWLPAVNRLGQHGRWAFAEFGEVYRIESEFEAKVEKEFAA